MTGKRQKAKKVKCKHDESTTKQSIFLEYILLYKKHLSLLELVRRRTENVTIIDQEKQNQTNFHLEPHDNRIYSVNIDLHP